MLQQPLLPHRQISTNPTKVSVSVESSHPLQSMQTFRTQNTSVQSYSTMVSPPPPSAAYKSPQNKSMQHPCFKNPVIDLIPQICNMRKQISSEMEEVELQRKVKIEKAIREV